MRHVDDSTAAQLLGSLELAVLRALWAGAPATVRAVLERINARRDSDLAYTSVMTVLDRLHDKELVTREQAGRAYEYTPVHDDEAGLVDLLLLGGVGRGRPQLGRLPREGARRHRS